MDVASKKVQMVRATLDRISKAARMTDPAALSINLRCVQIIQLYANSNAADDIATDVFAFSVFVRKGNSS